MEVHTASSLLVCCCALCAAWFMCAVQRERVTDSVGVKWSSVRRVCVSASGLQGAPFWGDLIYPGYM